jgi:hypothetical protein
MPDNLVAGYSFLFTPQLACCWWSLCRLSSLCSVLLQVSAGGGFVLLGLLQPQRWVQQQQQQQQPISTSQYTAAIIIPVSMQSYW